MKSWLLPRNAENHRPVVSLWEAGNFSPVCLLKQDGQGKECPNHRTQKSRWRRFGNHQTLKGVDTRHFQGLGHMRRRHAFIADRPRLMDGPADEACVHQEKKDSLFRRQNTPGTGDPPRTWTSVQNVLQSGEENTSQEFAQAWLFPLTVPHYKPEQLVYGNCKNACTPIILFMGVT